MTAPEVPMAQNEVELILMKQVARYLATPIFLCPSRRRAKAPRSTLVLPPSRDRAKEPSR